MTISININITCEPADIATLLRTITMPVATPGLTKADLADLLDTTFRKLGIPEATPFNLTPFEEDQNGAPPRTLTPRTPGNRPSKRPTPVAASSVPSVPPTPTEEGTPETAETAEKKIRPKTLPFTELDPLVRSEMKRLSMDGRMPGFKLWDTERDPRLPSLAALFYRYNVNNAAELAAAMGLQPPLTSKNLNGVHESVVVSPDR